MGLSFAAPLAGRDCPLRSYALRPRHFNPRAPCGVRPVQGAASAHSANFNPRTPCGARQRRQRPILCRRRISIHAPLAGRDYGLLKVLSPTYSISIHAPLAGCDGNLLQDIGCSFQFQSTHPLRGATVQGMVYQDWDALFQSTHPLRGATIVKHHARHVIAISIHAPLAGCDPGRRGGVAFLTHDFNPRTPCGVRLR